MGRIRLVDGEMELLPGLELIEGNAQRPEMAGASSRLKKILQGVGHGKPARSCASPEVLITNENCPVCYH